LKRLVRHPLVWGSISIVLLGLVAWRARPWELGDRLGTADGRPIALAIALNLVIVAAWAARSAGLLAGAGLPVPFLPLVPMTAFANTVNNVTPGSVGELARLYLLRAHHGVDYTTGGAVVVVERFVAIADLGMTAAILWIAYWFALPVPLTIVLVVVALALPSLVYRAGVRPSALIRKLPVGRVLGPERWLATGHTLSRVDDAVARLLHDVPRTVAFTAWTVLVFATYTAQLMLVATAIGQPLDPAAAWGALGLGIVAGVVSLLPFGLGSTDLVVAGLLIASGIAAGPAVAIVFGYRLVSTLPLGLLGVASYAYLSAGLPEGRADAAAVAVGDALSDETAETP
jgi:uncharacterized protein (TIRG00374 family)